MNKARPNQPIFASTLLTLVTAGCGSITQLNDDARVDTKTDGVAETAGADGGTDTFEPPADATSDVFGADASLDAHADRATDVAVDRPADVPVDRAADAPVDRGMDAAVDRPADVPADVFTDAGSTPDRSCICPRIFQPVCGTDGRTYSNSCLANCAGVPIAHNGPCETDAGMAMSCTTDSDCVLYPIYVGGCCGSCRAKDEPMPARITCIVACQKPYTGCLCVNNQCTPKGASDAIASSR